MSSQTATWSEKQGKFCGANLCIGGPPWQYVIQKSRHHDQILTEDECVVSGFSLNWEKVGEEEAIKIVSFKVDLGVSCQSLPLSNDSQGYVFLLIRECLTGLNSLLWWTLMYSMRSCQFMTPHSLQKLLLMLDPLPLSSSVVKITLFRLLFESGSCVIFPQQKFPCAAPNLHRTGMFKLVSRGSQ